MGFERRVYLPHLREVRLREGMSLRELARQSEVSKATIVEVENQRRPAVPRTHAALAKALKVHEWDLVVGPEQARAARDKDQHENALIKAQISAMSEEDREELRQWLASGPGITSAQVDRAASEREQLEAEQNRDAG